MIEVLLVLQLPASRHCLVVMVLGLLGLGSSAPQELSLPPSKYIPPQLRCVANRPPCRSAKRHRHRQNQRSDPSDEPFSSGILKVHWISARVQILMQQMRL